MQKYTLREGWRRHEMANFQMISHVWCAVVEERLTGRFLV
jgi:hypothetical protein